ncbi:MAG: FAD-dependent oxidoreductase, partial [Alphaproteobacteria bacterium]
MSETISFQRNIPIRRKVDVFVAGGGPAGCAAAVAARRQGCGVFLAEGQSCLGGMGTAGMVPAFMQFGNGVDFLAAGIGEEIYNKLRDAGGTSPLHKMAIRAEVLKRVYDDLLLNAGVDFTFQTHLVAVQTDGTEVTCAVLWGKGGLFGVRAKIFLDCTGDGDLAAWAGAPFEKGDEKGQLQAGTLCSLWADIDWDKVEAGGLGRGKRRIKEAVADNFFTVPDPHLPGIWPVSHHLGGGNVGHTFGVDGTDERSL